MDCVSEMASNAHVCQLTAQFSVDVHENVLSSSAYGQDPPQLLDVRRQNVRRK